MSGEKNVWKATGVRLKPIIPLPLRIILEYGETDFNGTKWFPSVSLQPLLGSAERDTGSGHDRIYPWTRVASSSHDSSSRERRRKNICARREQRPILGYVLEREREKVMNVQNKWFTAPVSVITSASWKNLHVSVMDLSDFSYRLPPRTKWRTNDASGFVRRAIVIGLSTLRALRSILIYRFLSQIVDSLLRESRHADIPDTVLLPEGIPQRKRAYRPSIVSGSPNLPPLPLLPLNDSSSLLNALRSSPIFQHATPSVVVTNDCRKRKIRPSWKVDGTSWINYTKRASQATSSWK